MKESLIKTEELITLKEKAKKWDDKVARSIELSNKVTKSTFLTTNKDGEEVAVFNISPTIGLRLSGSNVIVSNNEDKTEFNLGEIKTYGDFMDLKDILISLNND